MSAQWPNEPGKVDPQLAILAISGQVNGLMVCPMVLWPAASATEAWKLVYQQAYEQIVIAFSPSPFQRALEPSLN